MADENLTDKLAELLRHPEDLDKIAQLKADFARKKAGIDGQLKAGLKEQLEVTQSGMGAIGESQRIVIQIREEMLNIDKLCAESQNMIRDFPNINVVSTIHRNFSQVEAMKNNIESFETRLNELQYALDDDERDLENQPNLLNVHAGLSELRDIRDEAIDQLKLVDDDSLERDLDNYFSRLDDIVSLFDEHFGLACIELLNLLNRDNRSLIVRLALIIEEEEKNDMKVKAMQEAQKEHKELVSRFKSMKSGPKQLRGYKEKFLGCIELAAQPKFDAMEEKFLDDPEKLDKASRWFFNDLNAAKIGLTPLMPRKWKIFKTYTDKYHKMMHDWLVSMIDDKEKSSSMHILGIIHYREKYYTKMQKLGWNSKELGTDLIDDREVELVREWRQLIVNSVNEWMGRLFETDRKDFVSRNEEALDKDVNGFFRTKTLSDMWRMLKEQITVAGDSGRQDVVEGVVDEMFREIKRRQTNWQKLITEAGEPYTKTKGEPDPEGMQSLQDWLVAVANDQIACIDDNEEAGTTGYVTRFRQDYEPLVSANFLTTATSEMDLIADGYVDLSTHSISVFVSLIFAVDLRGTLSEFFTKTWYSEYGMKRITSTFDDYVADYADLLHPSLLAILLHELAETLLARYLLAPRNKGVKLRRSDPFTDKIGDDVRTAFAFFEKFGADADFGEIKAKWKAAHHMVTLLEADKAGVAQAYEQCKREFWDVQLSWVESVLRARDDYERSMLNAVKAKAAEVYVDRGPETIMSKVK